MKKKEINIEVKLSWPGIKGSYCSTFKVDEQSSISIVPKSKLLKAGFKPEGTILITSDNGDVTDIEYTLAVFEIEGEMMHGRVVMGPDDAIPVLGWWILKDYRQLRRRV